jgi:hypothetical protein
VCSSDLDGKVLPSKDTAMFELSFSSPAGWGVATTADSAVLGKSDSFLKTRSIEFIIVSS